jgi:hypothetical protein
MKDGESTYSVSASQMCHSQMNGITPKKEVPDSVRLSILKA